MDQYSSEDASRSSSIAADIPELPQHHHHQPHHQQQPLPRTRNGRKRKYIADDADIENQRPAKRHGGDRRSPIEASSAPAIPPPSVASSNSVASSAPPSSVQSHTSSSLGEYPTSDTQSSSECYSTTAEYDLFPLASPPSVNSNILSPACDATAAASATSRSSWNTKGDTTPHGHRKQNQNQQSDNSSSTTNSNSKSRLSASALPCFVTPSAEQRTCPLPKFAWARSSEVWRLICRKDEKASLEREPNMFDQHPGLQPRMRAILLDWLNEVCEVYKLHRETYYLAVDYIDRFLSRKKEQKKTHLQLLGITALFVAAKVEEIYPPKIGEFAYVTDGACSEDDILREELLLLSELQWSINPVTVMGWLGLYMQVNVANRTPEIRAEDRPSESFVYPQFSGMEFAQTAQLLDLCSLDVGLANFPYSVIAAAAISHTFDRKTATSVSGLDWEVIAPCAKWMEPYFLVICDENEISPLALLESNEQVKGSYGLAHVCPNLVADSSHIIQTHTTSLDMFDRAAVRRERLEVLACMIQQEASPAPILLDPEGLLTPPASSRKSLDANNPTSALDVENKVVSAKT